MLKIIRTYPAWFTDEMSVQVCDEWNYPRIPTTAWKTLEDLYKLPVPLRISPVELALTNRLDVIYFAPSDKEYHNVLFHPTRFFSYFKRLIRREIRKAKLNKSRKV